MLRISPKHGHAVYFSVIGIECSLIFYFVEKKKKKKKDVYAPLHHSLRHSVDIFLWQNSIKSYIYTNYVLTKWASILQRQ